ncbi:RNase H-like domain found in reverse transcriptase [Popillia japonica]|uniref:RNA-directed DNA polymerase n=1 Tax=Popillia japonica TaxID=7064 RepID=A0AAW1IDW9_POPJA
MKPVIQDRDCASYVAGNDLMFLKQRGFFALALANVTFPTHQNWHRQGHFPVPCSRKDVKSFIGLTSYFRKFVKEYSIIAKPLTDLLRAQNEFVFGEKELATFKTLQVALTSFPILCIYDPNLEIEVHTDASTKGYGAVLLQKYEDGFHPVYYFSGKTTETESKYHRFDLEMLAIIKALEKSRVYLLGKRFTLVTDCNSLKLSLKKRRKIAEFLFQLLAQPKSWKSLIIQSIIEAVIECNM